jgi:TolB-like protein
VAEHRGRIVKTTGDGILIEFPSVVEAVACAVAVQQGMVERNAAIPDDQRIIFRVGINLGDVIVEDGDIHGDGVNIAARLEALAQPGGVLVSSIVHDQVTDRLEVAFEDLGEQRLRNIARPVRVYRVATTSSSPALSAPPTAEALSRLSIVVLPFVNLSSDPEQEYFVDAITDDLTTDLSRIVGSFVISRTTAFTYKGKAVNVRQLARDLGVRYVLEGSVRWFGEQVQINVQLIDAANGTHVWTDRFSTDRSNLLRAQSEITGRLARTLDLTLIDLAGRQIEQEAPANLDARDLVMRGWAQYWRPISSGDNLQQALLAFERALELDPVSAEAKVGIASVLGQNLAMGRSQSRELDMARSEELLDDVLALDRNHAQARTEMGRLRRLQNRLIESKIELEKAVALNPNNSMAVLQAGITDIFLGQPELALPNIEKSIQLNPSHQNIFFMYFWLGYSHLLLERPELAQEALVRCLSANPTLVWGHLWIAGTYGLLGDVQRAREALRQFLSRRPDLCSITRLRSEGNYKSMDHPRFVSLRAKTLEAGLRVAGLPDE